VRDRSIWRAYALAAILMLALPEATRAAQPARQPKQWFCEGVAKGANGADVTLNWYVHADGTVVARSASWTPPSFIVTAALGGVATDLSILYVGPTMDGIGPPGSVLVDVAGTRRLDGASVTFELDDQHRWTAALTRWPPPTNFHVQIPNWQFLTGELAGANPDLLAAIETAGEGLATFTDKTGRTLSQVRYDLGARAERDRLYRTAWAAAERAAQHPKRCQKTVRASRFDLPSVPIP
jgi:hypothetical protein